MAARGKMGSVETVHFRAELRPNRSASRAAVVALALLLGGIAGATASAFMLAGVWTVPPFMGLEVGAALLLLRWHRRGTQREAELLELTEREFRITRTDRQGRVRALTLEPYWLRAEFSGRPRRVWLTSHGRSVSVGNLLCEEDRSDLHAALKEALARWRRR